MSRGVIARTAGGGPEVGRSTLPPSTEKTCENQEALTAPWREHDIGRFESLENSNGSIETRAKLEMPEGPNLNYVD